MRAICSPSLPLRGERSFTRAARAAGDRSADAQSNRPEFGRAAGRRLLNRTTRSVTPTQARRAAAAEDRTKFDEMDAELRSLERTTRKAGRDDPNYRDGISPAQAILMPAMAKLAPLYPDIKVEVMIDVGLTNIVAAQYDAGIWPGELVVEGHDRGAGRSGLAHGHGRLAVLFRDPCEPRRRRI